MGKVRYEQFAAMNMVYNKYSFSYFIDSLAKLEIKNFELWTGVPHICPFIRSLNRADEIRKVVECAGLNIVCVTPEQVLYPYNIASSNEELREASLQYFMDNIKITAQVGADKMLCCAGWGDYDGVREEAWKRSVDGLQRMVDCAKEQNVGLTFEVLCPTESNLVYDLATTKRMMGEIRDRQLGLCVDTVPVRLGGNTLKEYFAAFSNRISHVHLTDGVPMGHVPCGQGTHPVTEYLKTLSEVSYSGYITLEIGDTTWYDTPQLATETGFKAVRKLINTL